MALLNSRAKGANGERELAALLTAWAREVDVSLSLARNLEQTREGGYDLSGLELYGLAVECKRVETLSIDAWWKQTVRQARNSNLIPILGFRQNRKPWQFKLESWVYPIPVAIPILVDQSTFRIWYQHHLKRMVVGRAVGTGRSD